MATVETDLFIQPSPKKKGLAQKWADFRAFLWNAENKQFMGRNGKSWAQIGIFYSLFYFFLGLFFMMLLKIFYLTLDNNEPKVTLGGSLIGTSPGLSIHPRSEDNDYIVLTYKVLNNNSWAKMEAEYNSILAKYENQQTDNATTAVVCKYNETATLNRICVFDLELLGNICTKNNSYGFREGHFCVMLKLNKVYNWKPILYKYTDLKAMDEMGDLSVLRNDNHITVSCAGIKAEDKARLGEVDYYPEGFPIQFYPYLNQKNYLQPLIMVHFKSVVKNVIINVECRAWAKNIMYKKQPRMGSIRFELRID